MKQTKLFTLLLSLMLSFACAADESGDQSFTYYTVTFESNGGSAVSSEEVVKLTAVQEPEDPTKSGYTFTGWYTTNALTELWDFDLAITEDKTFYAGWEDGETPGLEDPDPDTIPTVSLISEIQIADDALYFNGSLNQSSTNTTVGTGSTYDYAYGKEIVPHGDCLKAYKDYVFMTWYRGGKDDRHMMLTRYNTVTGVLKHIEFPYQHAGFSGYQWWIGETHNTIAVAICPNDGTIHMAYDMHSYTNSKVANDYFRYSYSVAGAAEVSDDEFTLDLFVKDVLSSTTTGTDDYTHCTMTGSLNASNDTGFGYMSYPKFFLNDDGELFLCMRRGSSNDGSLEFIKYDESSAKWGSWRAINTRGAGSLGETKNWSIYGDMKFCAGKMRVGFQRRLYDTTDKFQYQNGVYYGYCEDPTGITVGSWRNYKGEVMTDPLVKAEELLVIEPGDWVESTGKDEVYIVDGFDFEVTERGDEHIVSKVKDKGVSPTVTKLLHTYRKAGDAEFTTEEYDAGDTLYASGDYIYIIGIVGKNTNIVMTEGGTSNFQEVYQHTGSVEFDKGIVYINDGKLYHYLKKTTDTSSDKQTTYLQIFDLGL